MSEEQMESGEITERFRAFAQMVDPKPKRPPKMVIAAAAAAVVVLAVAVTLVVTG